jgi:hypothetical protein
MQRIITIMWWMSSIWKPPKWPGTPKKGLWPREGVTNTDETRHNCYCLVHPPPPQGGCRGTKIVVFVILMTCTSIHIRDHHQSFIIAMMNEEKLFLLMKNIFINFFFIQQIFFSS